MKKREKEGERTEREMMIMPSHLESELLLLPRTLQQQQQQQQGQQVDRLFLISPKELEKETVKNKPSNATRIIVIN